MKIVNAILTYLFAAIFLILGVGNYFFHFIPMPTDMPPLTKAYMEPLMSSGYMTAIKIVELIAGLMIALNIKRALGWGLILPVVVNIVLYEFCIAKQPGMGVALLIINLYMVLFVFKDKYKSIWS